MAERYGVGILGAGPGVSALHLPTLARVADVFEVVHIADGGSGRAVQLADDLGVPSSRGIEDLLADPAVDVVAICSSADQHAVQLHASIDAGKRGIFCEKPLALSAAEVHGIVERLEADGVAALVGTNHLYDRAWAQARECLDALGPVQAISVNASMPSNARYHEVVFDGETGLALPFDRLDLRDPEQAAGLVRGFVVGVAVHDLPLIREIAPEFERIDFARAAYPVGYLVGYTASGVRVRLAATMGRDGADTGWLMRIVAAEGVLEIDFPPPFVHVGSAELRVSPSAGPTRIYPHTAQDSFESEWREFAARLGGDSETPYAGIREDSLYALAIAEAAGDRVKEQAG